MNEPQKVRKHIENTRAHDDNNNNYDNKNEVEKNNC